jgi:transcriptional regulator with XRE-family HTH domain
MRKAFRIVLSVSDGQTRAIGIPRWTLGDRLRKARTAAGFEREDFAEIFGCTPKTVGNYENGRTRAPKLVIREYALRCGVPIAWLESGVEPPDLPPSVTDGYRTVVALRRVA